MFPSSVQRGSNGTTARGSPITEIRHATPPRPNGSALPSSPSSQRLRRVAPSPIRIYPYTKLKYSPDSPTRIVPEGRPGRELRYQSRASDGASEVLSELTPSEVGLEDNVQMSRGEYVRAHYAREVMVDFRTDVFGPTSVSPPSPTSQPQPATAVERSSAYPPTNRASLHGSFATFGRNHSEKSILVGFHRRDTDDGDAWSISLSAYDREDNRDDHPPSGTTDQRPQQRVPSLEPGYEDSPATTDVELVTPDQDFATLIAHDSDEQDTPTRPRAKPSFKPGHGLQLSLTGLVDLDGWNHADAGVTPGPSDRRHATTTFEAVPPVPTLPTPEVALSHAGSATAATPASSETSDLADIDRSSFIDIHVDQEGAPGWTTRMPFRRISRPQVWQDKEESALASALKWNDPPPKPQPFQQTGCLVFGQPPRERDKWIFHQELLHSMPVIRQVTVNGKDELDYMRKKVKLAIKDYGVYHACGHDSYGRVEWQFEYLVIHRTNKAGDILPNDRIVCPMHFYVAPSFLAADRGISNGIAHNIAKRAQTALVSQRMTPPRLGRPPPPLPPVLTPHPNDTPKAERRVRNETSPAQIGREIHRHFDNVGLAPLTGVPMLTRSQPLSAASTPALGCDSSSVSTGSDRLDSPSATATSSSSSGGKMSGFLQKLGAKSKSRPGSRGHGMSPDTSTEAITAANGPKTTPSRPESVKSSKTRARAASLLSRMTRPFTPPSKEFEKGFPVAPKLTPMRSFASLRPDASPCYDDSPPVPALPAGFTITRPRSDSRAPAPAPQTNAHPFATALKPVDSPLDVSSSVVATTGSAGQPVRHYVVTSSKLRPASTILEPIGSQAPQDQAKTAGGLAPPRRPILRKRPSTADPCVNPSGRLVARTQL